VAQRKKWIEGLDWMRVENILDPTVGGSPERYTTLLAAMTEYLPDAEPDLDNTIRAEAKRRLEAGEMPREQAECYVEALRRSAEETGRLTNAIEKLLKRGRLQS
jgi:hypothetical protein